MNPLLDLLRHDLTVAKARLAHADAIISRIHVESANKGLMTLADFDRFVGNVYNNTERYMRGDAIFEWQDAHRARALKIAATATPEDRRTAEIVARLRREARKSGNLGFVAASAEFAKQAEEVLNIRSSIASRMVVEALILTSVEEQGE